MYRYLYSFLTYLSVYICDIDTHRFRLYKRFLYNFFTRSSLIFSDFAIKQQYDFTL